VLVLSRKRHSDQALLEVTGRDILEAEYALNSDDGLWRLDGATLADAAKTAEQRRKKQHLGDPLPRCRGIGEPTNGDPGRRRG
jgi:hypothetical protein